MKGSNLQIIFILLSSSLILIGYGHGIAPIVFLSLYMLTLRFTNSTEINLTETIENFTLKGSYEEVIPTVSIILTVGILLLITALFLKKNSLKKWILISGILFMVIGFLILILPLDEQLRVFSAFTGIPFLLLSIKYLIHFIMTEDFLRIKKAS